LALAEPPTEPLATPRRRSPAGRYLVVAILALIVVIGALILADFALRSRVETDVANRLQGKLGTPSAPSVDVGDFPFFVQALRGDLVRVHVLADDLDGNPAGSPLKVRHLDLTFSQITSDDRFRTATAADASGVAMIDLAQVSALAGTELSYAGDGRVGFTTSTSLLGRSLDVSGSGRPDVNVPAQTITLADVKLNVAGVTLPAGAAAVLQGTLLKPIPITGVPLGLQVVGLSVSESGVQARLHGSDVRVAG